MGDQNPYGAGDVVWYSHPDDDEYVEVEVVSGYDGTSVEVDYPGRSDNFNVNPDHLHGDEEIPLDSTTFAPVEDAEVDGTPVEEITGVGSERADELRDAGIDTVEDVKMAGISGLVDAGISEGVAENIIEAAS